LIPLLTDENLNKYYDTVDGDYFNTEKMTFNDFKNNFSNYKFTSKQRGAVNRQILFFVSMLFKRLIEIEIDIENRLYRDEIRDYRKIFIVLIVFCVSYTFTFS